MSENRKNWFIENIGKVIYRTNFNKNLNSRDYITVTISNKKHAIALYNIESNSSRIKYFDNVEELKQYETLKQF